MASQQNGDKPLLFVGSSVESISVAYAVQENLERVAEVTVWDQGVFEISRYALESLAKSLITYDFAVFIFTPDDVAVIRDEQFRIVRDNVVFELGLFIGHLGRHRTFVITPRGTPELHLPTDLLGVTLATYTSDRRDKNLKAALGPACHQISRAIEAEGVRSELHPRSLQNFRGESDLTHVGDEQPDSDSRPPDNHRLRFRELKNSLIASSWQQLLDRDDLPVELESAIHGVRLESGEGLEMHVIVPRRSDLLSRQALRSTLERLIRDEFRSDRMILFHTENAQPPSPQLIEAAWEAYLAKGEVPAGSLPYLRKVAFHLASPTEVFAILPSNTPNAIVTRLKSTEIRSAVETSLSLSLKWAVALRFLI